jgi:hypothetical protein
MDEQAEARALEAELASGTSERELVLDLVDAHVSFSRAAAALAARSRPELRALTLRWHRFSAEAAERHRLRTSSGRVLLAPDPRGEPVPAGAVRAPLPLISADLVRALCAATPRLERLVLVGEHVVPELRHASLRTLCVRGFSVVHELGTQAWHEAQRGDGAMLPALTRLELYLDATAGIPANMLSLPAERLPRLRHLALYGNNYESVMPWLLDQEVLDELEVLRVPWLRTLDVRALLAARERVAHLSELSVGRLRVDDALTAELRRALPMLRVEGTTHEAELAGPAWSR